MIALLNSEDIQAIRQAIQEGGKIWENTLLTPVKRKIKLYLHGKFNEQCCYCKRDSRDEFNMVIDIEHILPKSIFLEYMFTAFNLSVSCKRCNMRIKKDRVDFISNLGNIRTHLMDSSLYYFIHPNADNYFSHLHYKVQIVNDKKLIKYIPQTQKGAYTYNYFELNKIEIDSFNNAQGVEEVSNELSELISSEIQDEIQSLLKQL